MPEIIPEPTFLTVPELGVLLRVKPSTVYEWTRQVGPDAIPAYKAGKRLLFDREEVLAWFKRTRRREPSPSFSRFRRVHTTARRRAPNNVSGGQQRRRADGMRVSANGPAPVALEVPSDG